MSTTTSINFKENYFKYPSLTKIRGEPSVESLTILIRQLLANAKKVPNDEHATYGYIGLILSDEEYAALTPAPTAVFRAPAIPVEPRDGGTQFEIQQRMHTYKEQQKRRAEYILMHNTMFNLIQEAIESEYLEAKVDPLTGDFDCTIPELIAYLKTTYGYISPAELQEKQDEVTKMVWDISKPVDFVFNKIDTVASLFDMARKTLTTELKIHMAILVLSRSGVNSDDLRTWKHVEEQTWPSFKNHFREAQQELRTTRPALGDITNFHEANSIQANAILQEALATAKADSLMQTLTAIMERLEKIENKPPPKNKPEPPPKAYCWTHGWCRHSGTQCNQPKDGHQAQATKTNKMGGSTKRCE